MTNNKYNEWGFKFWLEEIYGVSNESWNKKTAEEKEEIYSNYELGGGVTGADDELMDLF